LIGTNKDLNVTQQTEANIAASREKRFFNAHRILLCYQKLPQATDKTKCHKCGDFLICHRFRDILDLM
jgi:hypothetical protein